MCFGEMPAAGRLRGVEVSPWVDGEGKGVGIREGKVRLRGTVCWTMGATAGVMLSVVNQTGVFLAV
jgi:hypothetical protein